MPAGSRVVLIDDLLATGGTAQATVELMRKIGAEVAGAVFLIELMGLKGRARLDVPMTTLLGYEGGEPAGRSRQAACGARKRNMWRRASSPISCLKVWGLSALGRFGGGGGAVLGRRLEVGLASRGSSPPPQGARGARPHTAMSTIVYSWPPMLRRRLAWCLSWMALGCPPPQVAGDGVVAGGGGGGGPPPAPGSSRHSISG